MTTKTLDVLVPLDGSETAEAVLPVVLGLRDPAVTIVRVLEAPAGDESTTDMIARERAAGTALEPVAERLRAAGAVRVEVIVRTGRAAERILDVAVRFGSSLIAMVTHGRTGVDRLVLGSVFDRIVRTAPIPVLAVTPQYGAPPAPGALFARTLVPHDGSEIATRAIDALARLGEAGRAKLTVLGVVESYGGPDAVPLDKLSDDLAVRYIQLRAQDARKQLDEVVAHAKGLGFEADAAVAVGPPAQRIIERAAEIGATAIAMTTHGRSGIARWALGSVTDKVVRAAGLPVLVCR